MSTTATQKIAAVQIEFNFSEAGWPIANRIFKGTKTLTCWQQANKAIFRHAFTMDPRGSYDKTDFRVTFADGDTYTGRIDISNRDHAVAAPLSNHIASHCAFASGRSCPGHMARADYDRVVSGIAAEHKASAAKVLDEYDLGA